MGSLKKYMVHLLFVCSIPAAAQERLPLEGRIRSLDGDVAGTHILNLTAGRAAITDVNGFFSIPVRLNDTLVFSAVQYKRKELVVNWSVLESKFLSIFLEDALTELDEVIIRPYNLSGELGRDVYNRKTGPVITASTLDLPNAYVKVKTTNERRLFEADNGTFIRLEFDSLLYIPTVMINLHKILNRVSGRTKKLKSYVAQDAKIALLEKVRRLYPDSVYIEELGIPENKLHEFMYYCEADSLFKPTAERSDLLEIWEFLQRKSILYKKNNDLDK